MKILDELERLSKATLPYRLVEDNGPTHLIIGTDKIDVSPRNAELVSLMRNNIRALIEVARAAQMQFDHLVEEKKNHFIVLELEEALAKLESGE